VEHPPGGFRKVPSYRSYSLLMALSFSDSGVKLSHMAEGIFLVVAGNHVGGLTISPLEIAIHVFPGLSVTHFAPALLDPRDHSRVGSKCSGPGNR